MLPPRNNVVVGRDRWVRCVHCGHKLGRVTQNTNRNDCCVEIKCHSCKTINLCRINKNK